MPLSPKAKTSKAAKISTERRNELVIEGRFDLLPPEHRRMYEYIRWKSIAKSLTDLTEYSNIWIIGTASSGNNDMFKIDLFIYLFLLPM